MNALPFIKMHGCGNDYVYVDAFTKPRIEKSLDLPALARAISDRHHGVGSDGLILLCKPTKGAAAHVRMRMFNADGSESEMCGNGVRCVAKFAHDRLHLGARTINVETGRGILSIACQIKQGKVVRATVNMGEPILDLPRIPVAEAGLAWTGKPYEAVLHLPHANPIATFVSMGNPHAVIFLSPKEQSPEKSATTPEAAAITATRLAEIALDHLGPQIERHPAFPNRANVHFVECFSPSRAAMRSWERGAGATMACGTGACAVLVAGVLTGRLSTTAEIDVPGGQLFIRWDRKRNRVFKTGPAEDVFQGSWPLTKK